MHESRATWQRLAVCQISGSWERPYHLRMVQIQESTNWTNLMEAELLELIKVHVARSVQIELAIERIDRQIAENRKQQELITKLLEKNESTI